MTAPSDPVHVAAITVAALWEAPPPIGLEESTMLAYARLAAALALAVSCATAPAAAADLYEPPYEEERYGDGPPPPDRYAAAPEDFEPPYPDREYAGRRCVPRELARDRLRDAGWYDFHALERREDVVLVKARRDEGRLYDLTIDRCSGEVVDARPIHRRGLGPYAWGGRRYWGAPRY
jgi:hypothetical protein